MWRQLGPVYKAKAWTGEKTHVRLVRKYETVQWLVENNDTDSGGSGS